MGSFGLFVCFVYFISLSISYLFICSWSQLGIYEGLHYYHYTSGGVALQWVRHDIPGVFFRFGFYNALYTNMADAILFVSRLLGVY
jgi:hypothetical protein